MLLEPARPFAARDAFVGLCLGEPASDVEGAICRVVGATYLGRKYGQSVTRLCFTMDNHDRSPVDCGQDRRQRFTRWCWSALYRNDAYRATARCRNSPIKQFDNRAPLRAFPS
jgi:hypothetical protein